MAHDVFISYSNKDKTIADAVCAKLEEQKIRCWIAPRDIPAGKNFAESIIKAINESKVFVLIWSGNTNTSEHILNEINQAFDQSVIIIPFRIENVEPTLAMRYYFGRTHWLDALTPPLENHIGTLIRIIDANLGRKPETLAEASLEEPDKEPGMELKRSGEIRRETKPFSKEELKLRAIPQINKKEKGNEFQPQKKRAPLPKRVIIPISGGILVVAVLVLIYALGLFKNLSFSSTPGTKTAASISSSTVPLLSPTAISIAVAPTLTGTPLPNWVTNFSEPIFTAIKNQKPDFIDDFSFLQSVWDIGVVSSQPGCTHTIAIVTEGVLQLTVDPDCYAQAPISNLQLLNFAVQVDMDLKNLSKSSDLNYRTEIVIGDNDIFEILSNGHWAFVNCKSENCFLSEEGSMPLDASAPVTVTVISFGSENAAYINGIPVSYFMDTEQPSAHGFRIQLSGGREQTPYNIASYDNLRIWDLDKISNLSSLLK